MKIKIVFFDLDGTLASNHDYSLPFEARIPESAFTAIRLLKEKGIFVALATGRSLANIKDLQEILNLSTLVLSNGAYVLHNNIPIITQFIPYNTVLSAIHTLEKIDDINVILETSVGDFIVGEKRSSLSFIGDNLPHIQSMDDIINYDVFQVIGNGYDISEKLGPLDPTLTVKKFGPHAFDISLAGIHKGLAIKDLLERLNILPEEAMAFGDEENDIEMFKAVATSVALADSNPRLLDLATFVTKSVDEDGVYHALKHYQLI